MFLNVEQFCNEMHISRPTADRWIRSGKIPSTKVGGRRLIDRADLAAFIANGRKPAVVEIDAATVRRMAATLDRLSA